VALIWGDQFANQLTAYDATYSPLEYSPGARIVNVHRERKVHTKQIVRLGISSNLSENLIMDFQQSGLRR
jgi:hypothetical protein